VGRLALLAVAAALPGQGWWSQDVGADQAAPPDTGVPIVIVDSGVDTSHPPFSGRPNTTLLNDQTVDGPGEYHGTAVASLAIGVFPQAALYSWDASPRSGVSDLAAVSGIETAAEHCPAVINLSFGSTEPAPEIDDAVLTAVHNGCLVVAAAGNDAQLGNPTTYPAAYPHVLTVAATDEHDAPLPFSTFGPWVDLAAPGIDITAAVSLSHDPSGYSSGLAGTSFAAPLVSAAAAWIWTVRPTLTVDQLAAVLRESARDVATPGFDAETGHGVLDIPAALAASPPPADPDEPNDDVDQIAPGRLFPNGQPPLTSPGHPSIRIAASLDQSEDPRDLYRVWVPARRVVRATVAAVGNVAARIWVRGRSASTRGSPHAAAISKGRRSPPGRRASTPTSRC
jgi:subtilisin family serine protease